jgi:hypothetical protein
MLVGRLLGLREAAPHIQVEPHPQPLQKRAVALALSRGWKWFLSGSFVAARANKPITTQFKVHRSDPGLQFLKTAIIEILENASRYVEPPSPIPLQHCLIRTCRARRKMSASRSR